MSTYIHTHIIQEFLIFSLKCIFIIFKIYFTWFKNYNTFRREINYVHTHKAMLYCYCYNKNYLFSIFMLSSINELCSVKHYLPSIIITAHIRTAVMISVLGSMSSISLLWQICILPLSPQSQTWIVRVFVLVRDGIPLSAIKMDM